MEWNDYCVILLVMVLYYFKFLLFVILYISIVFFVCYFLKDVVCLFVCVFWFIFVNILR